MAVSDAKIANLALQKLGSPKRIESLTQDSPNARSMNACFANIRDAELRRHDWGFAIKRASVAAQTDQTDWGNWNRFALPADYLRLIRDDETGVRPDWRIEGQYIVTADAGPLYIRYVAKITDPNVFDSLFVEALAAKLAYQTCKEITGSTTQQGAAKADYDFAISEAKKMGSIEEPARDFPDDDWLLAMR